MIFDCRNPTPELKRRLRELHDDGTPPLTVMSRRFAPSAPGYLDTEVIGNSPDPAPGCYEALVICRSDNSELSPSEQAHVRGLLAAHRVEKIE